MENKKDIHKELIDGALRLYLWGRKLDGVKSKEVDKIIDAFLIGANYTSEYYQLQLSVLEQKIESLTTQIGEILGGVPQGTSYIIRN